MKLWIAKDMTGDVFAYAAEPRRELTAFTGVNMLKVTDHCSGLTFENSPVEIEVDFKDLVFEARRRRAYM